MNNVLAILLAGGVGERLHPLTRDTAKPAVPFGGAYRIIDFTLSNCINSGVRRIFILTQYKSLDLSVEFDQSVIGRSQSPCQSTRRLEFLCVFLAHPTSGRASWLRLDTKCR